MLRVFLIVCFGIALGAGLITLAVADDATTCRKDPFAEGAITACTRAIASAKVTGRDLGILYNARGLALGRTGAHARAIADFDEAIRLIPNSAPLYSNRGTAWYRRGDQDRAIADFNESIRLNPNDEATFRARGNSWVRKGVYERAIADFSEAIRIKSNDSIAYNNRGYAYARTGENARAIADYSKAVSLDPKRAEAIFARGQAHETAGDYRNALADYRAALALASGDTFTSAAVQRMEQKLATARPIASPPRKSEQAQPGSAETRIALIIGNGAYRHSTTLPNPRNDAEALADTLRRIGFTKVTLQLDLTHAQMVEALTAFAKAATSADWAVLYYAGHGIELGGINLLLPVDVKLTSDRDALQETVELAKAMEVVGGARKLGIVILDACRHNPFADTIQRSMPSTRNVGTGLAPVEPEGATLVAYAAKHGQTASDSVGGGSRNSPFMTALIKQLETPGLELNLLFRRVRDEVLRLTERKQEPFTYASLPADEFYFRRQ